MTNKNYKKIFAKNLKRLLDDNNITQGELSDRLNISKSVISSWCTGTRLPRMDKVDMLSKYFNVKRSELLEEKGNNIFSIKNVMPVPENEKIPLYISGIACGSPIEAFEDDVEYIDKPTKVKADFAIICKGDSMINAHIKDGSIVYIKKQANVDNGKIAAVRINGDATLKKVFIGPDTLTLVSANDNYPPMTYILSELEDVVILGEAVAYLSII